MNIVLQLGKEEFVRHKVEEPHVYE